MDYSAANSTLWNVIIQFGLIAAAILLAFFLRAKLAFVRKSMMPIAVLAGFLLLIAKYLGLENIDGLFMEMLVYHGIALGFIAMSLRVPAGEKGASGDLTGLKSGAIIVSTYLIQAVAGLLITILLGLVSAFLQTKLSDLQMEHSAKEAKMRYDVIHGIQKIRLSGAEKRFFAKWL